MPLRCKKHTTSFHGHKRFSGAQKYDHYIRQIMYDLRDKNENYKKCSMSLLVKKQ